MKQKCLSCLLALLLLVSLFPVQALAASVYGLVLTPYQGGFSFEFSSDQDYILFTYSTSMESGKILLHSVTGDFSGDVSLPCTVKTDSLRVVLYDLKGSDLLAKYATTVSNPQKAQYAEHPYAVTEKALRARNLTATPL